MRGPPSNMIIRDKKSSFLLISQFIELIGYCRDQFDLLLARAVLVS